jgi:hypothetical protein
MIIDREAATRAVQTTYPNATINRPENPSDWIRTQLALKHRGQAHSVQAVAIYEEWADVKR